MAKANRKAVDEVAEIKAAPAEKDAAKKSSEQKSIKYSDKSLGQPQLVIVFENIKAISKPYAKGTIKERGEKEGIYNLVSEKHIEIAGKKLDEIYFASIIVQKGFVGFYYTPIYAIEGIKEQLKPELLNA